MDDGSKEEPTNKAVLTAITALSMEVNQFKTDICSTIDNCITEVSAAIRGEISSLNQSLQKSISKLNNKTAAHDLTLKELEATAIDQSDTITTLKNTIDRLTEEVKQLDDRCEDLQARSRRNNILITGISEGKEGLKPRDFIAKLLAETFSLESQPLVDRIHRTNRKKPACNPLEVRNSNGLPDVMTTYGQWGQKFHVRLWSPRLTKQYTRNDSNTVVLSLRNNASLLI